MYNDSYTIFETSNRLLEQFLFAHEIRFNSFFQDKDGMTYWQYTVTPRLERIVDEYNEVAEIRRQRRAATKHRRNFGPVA